MDKQVMVSKNLPEEEFNSVVVQVNDDGIGTINFLKETDEDNQHIYTDVVANMKLASWEQLKQLRDALHDVLSRHERN